MLTQNPNIPSDYVILAQICQEKGVDMSIVVRPEKHRDDVSATKRAGVLREAHAKGITISSLTSLCPMSEQWIRRVVNNGSGIVFKRSPQGGIIRDGSQTDGA